MGSLAHNRSRQLQARWYKRWNEIVFQPIHPTPVTYLEKKIQENEPAVSIQIYVLLQFCHKFQQISNTEQKHCKTLGFLGNQLWNRSDSKFFTGSHWLFFRLPAIKGPQIILLYTHIGVTLPCGSYLGAISKVSGANCLEPLPMPCLASLTMKVETGYL